MKRMINYTDEVKDIMEAYDEEFDDFVEDELASDEAVEEDCYTEFDTPHCVEQEIIDDGYKILGLTRIKRDENGQELLYDADPENLKVMFDMYRNGTELEKESAGRLIEYQLRGLVYSIGHKYFPSYMANKQEIKELVQHAWIGVFQAANDYDPTRAAPSTYFYRPILHEMSEFVNRFLQKTSSYSMNVRKKIRIATERLIEHGNHTPSILDLAYESGLRASAIHKALDCEYYANSRSLEEMPVDPGEYSHTGNSKKARDDYASLHRDAVDEYSDPLTVLCEREEKGVLGRAMDTLSDLHKDILCRLFGIGCPRQSYTEIFKETHIPTDRIKMIEAQAKNRLRENEELRGKWRGGKAAEIKRDLEFEPVCITPDEVAFSMMSVLDSMETVDFC